MAKASMKKMLEAGVHFGHRSRFWHPKMEPYIYGTRNGVHIINLEKTLPQFNDVLNFASKTASQGGSILFVGTKRQASEVISETASSCAQYYVNHRWLGGTLTNWKTISNTISRLKSIQETLDNIDLAGLTKKELLKLTRERDKLERSIGGIKDMGGLPDLIFVIDTVKEDIAIKEAIKLKIPIAAIIDSNSNPEGIDYPIPGNDDSAKCIRLYCDLVARAAIDGLSIQSEEKVSSKEDKISNVKENEKQDIEQPKDDEEVKAEESKDISKASPEEKESKKGSKTISKKTTISKVKKDPKAKNTEN